LRLAVFDAQHVSLSECFDQAVLWRSYPGSDFPDALSIPKLVEENADSLRSRYLAWVYELGESIIDGKRLIDHFQLRPGFSYWWMTLIAEKCNFAKSPLITDAIRLFAFDDWAREAPKITTVTLVSANKPLHESFKYWCKLNEIEFESKFIQPVLEPKSLIRLTFDRLPYVVQAGISLLKYLIERWPLRGVGLNNWKQTPGHTTFISYFFNLLPQAAQAGQFESQYWTRLPQLLGAAEENTSWLHIFVKNPVVPDAKSAAKLLQRFNNSHESKQAHVVLDSFLSTMTVISAVRDFGKVRRLGRLKVERVLQSKAHTASSIMSILWPLFREDWDRSFFGAAAMQNLLVLNLFERAMSNLPKQHSGIYLQENQGWEFAMIHAWRAAGHEKLIGFPHSTVRFWDLRYFFDPRTYERTLSALPRPEHVAVSGDFTKNAYLDGGYPSKELVEVEALRYLHLGDSDKQSRPLRTVSKKKIQVLILGDYLASNTSRQMEILCGLSNDLACLALTVKPHPACPINPADYPELRFVLSNEPISELSTQFDVAYTSSVTSAAVDAYCAGLKVISVLDPTTLNLSPLRGVEGVEFVSSSEQLLDVLERIILDIDASELRKPVPYFNVDSSLPAWISLLFNKKDHEKSISI